MPLKVNVGLSKKLGLPKYGSLGAACHVELELASELLSSDVATFQRHVRNAYIACRQAVEDELAHHRNGVGDDNSRDARQPDSRAIRSSCEMPDRSSLSRGRPDQTRHSRNSDQANELGPDDDSAPTRGRLASPKQHEYIRRLANGTRGVGIRRLSPIALRMFGKPLAELSSFEASSLIDALKATKAGEIDVEAALERAA